MKKMIFIIFSAKIKSMKKSGKYSTIKHLEIPRKKKKVLLKHLH